MSQIQVRKMAKQIADFYREDPNRWAKGFFAKNGCHDPVHPDDPTATSWCLTGACMKLQPDREVRRELLEVISEKTGYEFVSVWNDDQQTTLPDIILTLEKIACE